MVFDSVSSEEGREVKVIERRCRRKGLDLPAPACIAGSVESYVLRED